MARDEVTSWATPLVLERDGKRQIVVSASKRIRSYDAANGAVLWEIGGMTGNVIPTPVADAERVYCMSGFRGSALLAIRFGTVSARTQTLILCRREGAVVGSRIQSRRTIHFAVSSTGMIVIATQRSTAQSDSVSANVPKARFMNGR